jgi:hypothetical protein
MTAGGVKPIGPICQVAGRYSRNQAEVEQEPTEETEISARFDANSERTRRATIRCCGPQVSLVCNSCLCFPCWLLFD